MNNSSIIFFLKLKLNVFRNKSNLLLKDYPGLFSLGLGIMSIYFYWLYENIYIGLRGFVFQNSFYNFFIFVRQVFILYYAFLIIGLGIVSYIGYHISIKFLRENMNIPLEGDNVITASTLYYSIAYFLFTMPLIATILITIRVKIYVFIAFLLMFIFISLINLIFLQYLSYMFSNLFKWRNKFIKNIYVYVITLLVITTFTYLFNKYIIFELNNIIYFYLNIFMQLIVLIFVKRIIKRMTIIALIENYTVPISLGVKVFSYNIPMELKIEIITILRNIKIYIACIVSYCIILFIFRIIKIPINDKLLIQIVSINQIYSLGFKYSYRFQFQKLPLDYYKHILWNYVCSLIPTIFAFECLIKVFSIHSSLQSILLLYQASTLIFILELIIKYPLNLDKSDSIVFILFYQLILSIVVNILPLAYSFFNSYLISIIVFLSFIFIMLKGEIN